MRDGKVAGVVFATLALDRATAALARMQLPEGARVLVSDRHGRLLMEYPPRPGLAVPRQLEPADLLERRVGAVAAPASGWTPAARRACTPIRPAWRRAAKASSPW
jgi:hypothetical protein